MCQGKCPLKMWVGIWAGPAMLISNICVEYDCSCGEKFQTSSIIDWCGEKLADFNVPGSVRFAGGFPRTSLGKVQKNILKQQALSEPPAGA